MDFMKISTRSVKQGVTEIFPKFILKKSSDLMIRGGDFYAVWREDLGLLVNRGTRRYRYGGSGIIQIH